MMFPSEFLGTQTLAQECISHVDNNCSVIQSNMSPLQDFDNFLAKYMTLQNAIPGPDFNSQSSCVSNNSTSDEGDELHLSIINERKQRRMISNRESARRSRMRKQKHLDELLSQVYRLRTEKNDLIDKLNNVSESHDKVLLENARLKEEASNLRRMVTDIQLASTYNGLRDLEELPCTTPHLIANTSPNCKTV
ncbi:hypothetical protein DCAR_0934928 [Daucus carota subsp. sativus]|uniref:Uncharacterized protein n=1 Tax=Daucus carota subsp. sativus TaxID=79200 RepID=A0A175YFW8_DAUCS|nr:PREDICTED: basic leucine zipper 43-like [Daucus carota subsp. sativus]WOH15390.1 hypothetical protein DCAR_0934928 [Daucus carota subsp. sativus]